MMKKIMAILMSAVCASSMSASATIIAGWDTWVGVGGDIYAPTITNGASATAVGTASAGDVGWANWSNTTYDQGASTDGVWGATLTEIAPSTSVSSSRAAVGLLNATASGEMTITIQNTSGSFYDLTGFYFDGTETLSKGAQNWTLSILPGSAVSQGSVTNGTLATARPMPAGGFDIPLTGLADRRLENGESVIFELAFSGGDGSGSGGHNAMIDNLAVTAIPEPATLGLIGLVSAAMLFIRRRFKV